MYFQNKKVNLAKPTKKEKLLIRRKTAMVFQNYNLFKNKTALENITEGPIYGQGMKKEKAIELAEGVLKKVGLLNKKNFFHHNCPGDSNKELELHVQRS